MPRGGALAIVGADSMGKANDKEVSGDAEEVTQRRSEVLRRRTVAIQALLEEEARARTAQPQGRYR